jgi:hypothetical protein
MTTTRRGAGNERRGGQNERSSSRPNQRVSVAMPADAAAELLALLRDEDGDADEDLLEVAAQSLRNPKRSVGAVRVSLDERERRMTLRAIEDYTLEFGSLIRSSATRLAAAITTASAAA